MASCLSYGYYYNFLRSHTIILEDFVDDDHKMDEEGPLCQKLPTINVTTDSQFQILLQRMQWQSTHTNDHHPNAKQTTQTHMTKWLNRITNGLNKWINQPNSKSPTWMRNCKAHMMAVSYLVYLFLCSSHTEHISRSFPSFLTNSIFIWFSFVLLKSWRLN